MAAIHIDGRIITVNDAFATPLGHEPAELVGRTVFDIGAEPPVPDQAIRLARLVAEGMIPAVTRLLRTRSGGVVQMRIAAILVRDGRARPRFVLLTGQTID